MAATLSAQHDVRPLDSNDVEQVIAIDRVHTGHARRHFFEKRFAAAKLKPNDFIHIGVMRAGAMRGFAITRILRGEFGREHVVAALDAVGVELEGQERGIGKALMAELTTMMRRTGAHAIQTQADWTNHNLLRFFAASGWKLSPRLALERSVTKVLDEKSEEI
jgi:ribosomal protein S18 acetylase RimI-like enzyme